MAQSPVSRVIQAVARETLRPLGLFQQGRSRTWLDDHGWFVIVAEFQPSDWSQGSYLNVGCCWLWFAKSYLSFDYSFDPSSRVHGFEQFRSPEQFAPRARLLVEEAAQQVRLYRSRLRTVTDLAMHYRRRAPSGFWPCFHAAVAYGLTGQPVDAARCFRMLQQEAAEIGYDWMRAASDLAEQYLGEVHDRGRFRESIEGVIQETRHLLRLPEVPRVLTPEVLGGAL